MEQRPSWIMWCEENKDVPWGLIRIYFGFALVVKGFVYFLHIRPLVTMMTESGVPLAGSGLATLVALCHVAGGLLLAFGFLARLGALIQIPNLLGAVLFVHLKSGLFTDGQTLEFSLLVLALLVMFAAGGAGKLSVDWYFEDTKDRDVRLGRVTPVAPEPSVVHTHAKSPA